MLTLMSPWFDTLALFRIHFHGRSTSRRLIARTRQRHSSHADNDNTTYNNINSSTTTTTTTTTTITTTTTTNDNSNHHNTNDDNNNATSTTSGSRYIANLGHGMLPTHPLEGPAVRRQPAS